jgi:disulfide bond formation protein DsbB
MALAIVKALTPRRVFLGVAAVCAALIGFALYLQTAENLEPCPLCILQRYAFVLVGALALLAALVPSFLSRGVASLAGLLAWVGAAVGGWHLWLQLHPPAVSSCGPSLEYMVSNLPPGRLFPRLFQGGGDCTDIQWTLLGLSIPGWSMICLALIGIALFWAQAQRKV